MQLVHPHTVFPATAKPYIHSGQITRLSSLSPKSQEEKAHGSLLLGCFLCFLQKYFFHPADSLVFENAKIVFQFADNSIEWFNLQLDNREEN
jgi:hypothetical protein